MQIILSDDCSPDDTFEIMQEVVAAYHGPHRVEVYRNPVNFGIAGHLNAVLARCTGDIFILAAGDDISHPTRVRDTLEGFEADHDQALLALQAAVIRPDGRLLAASLRTQDHSLEDFFEDRSHPHGAARGYRRDVFELFGPLAADCPTEDTTFLFRSLLLGRVRSIAREGIVYRKHAASVSAPGSMRQMRIDAIFRQYLVDLEVARARGLVDTRSCERHRAAVERKGRRRAVSHRLAYGSENHLKKLLIALFSPGPTLRQRLRFVRSTLGLRRVARFFGRKS